MEINDTAQLLPTADSDPHERQSQAAGDKLDFYNSTGFKLFPLKDLQTKLRSKTPQKFGSIARMVKKCASKGCDRPLYKHEVCKHHMCNQIKIVLRKELRNIYRGAEKAYASMDFSGKGFINEQDFLNSLVMTRIAYTADEVKEYFKQSNLFAAQNTTSNNGQAAGGINFDQFKKSFFPQFYFTNEDAASEDEKQNKKNHIEMNQNQEKQPEIIAERLKKLEKVLKNKFSNNWESVRKAFLALDGDYDGFITVEDILRHFGQEKDLNYNDLKKIIMDKDSKKLGKIGYSDFSKWLGNTIHQSEGFYFRHDSIKNPQFDKNLERAEQNLSHSKKVASEILINQNLEKTVLDKMQFQWKTLRKAFMDLNVDKSGAIKPSELRFYFKHWGLNYTDEQFQFLFNKFDLDGDGKISYKDFQVTVGSEIHPAEGLYFRQDKPQMAKINCCKHDQCWNPTQGHAAFCAIHQKMHQDQCIQLFSKIFKQLALKWRKLISYVKQAADPDDQNQIYFDKFISILKKFNVQLSESESQNLLDSFPGRDIGLHKRINISKIYDQKFSILLAQMYQKLDVHENDGADDPVDQAGYTGQFYRAKLNLLPITEQEFVQVISQKDKLADIIRTIKEIDKQRNGFVTATELDDIFKMYYKVELGNRDLKTLLKPYASIQNRILIDYKSFKDNLIKQLRAINASFSYKDSPSPQKQQITKSETLNNSIIKGNVSRQDNSEIRNNDTLIQIKELLRPRTRDVIRSNSKNYVMRQKNYNKDLNQTISVFSKKLKMNTSNTISENPSHRNLLKGKNETSITPHNDYNDPPKQINNKSTIQINQNAAGISLINQIKNKRNNQSQADKHFRTEQNKSLNISSRFVETVPNLHDSYQNQSQDINLTSQKVEKNKTKNINFFKTHKQQSHIQSTTSEFEKNTMYQTISYGANVTQQASRFKDVLRTKLSYEWKGIYRLLSVADKENKGVVSREEFEASVQQCGAFLTKEDIKKIGEKYGQDNMINYQTMSTDLGLHNSSYNFMKSSHSRIQTVQRLRSIYSSNEKKHNFTIVNTMAGTTLDNSFITKENSKQEVKDTLMKKIKEFRDLIHMFQKKTQQQNAVLPISEFKAVLKGVGINLSTQALQKFIVNQPNERPKTTEQRYRAKSSCGAYPGAATHTMYNNNGVGCSGVDAREFLKYYL